MCIFAISVNNHPKYKIIIASNRDEFFSRKTVFAHIWDNNIIAGKDLKMGGTWLGLNIKDKKIAILTNYRNPKLINMNYKSRGMLVLDYLTQKIDIKSWRINIKKENYNPFNIILGSFNNLYYYNNINNKLKKLNGGIHVLSNGFLNEPWPKVEKLRKLFTKTIKSDFSHQNLIEIMKDEEKFPENQLPNTNISKEMEYFLSSIFINSKKYGTRATTIITIDYQNNINFTEISYNNKKEIIGNNRQL
jgi:uncharacterized protein with NRDE domain